LKSKKAKLVHVQFSVELYEDFQEAIRGTYETVSEAIRDLARQFIKKKEGA